MVAGEAQAAHGVRGRAEAAAEDVEPASWGVGGPMGHLYLELIKELKIIRRRRRGALGKGKGGLVENHMT
jgi:hypothetical protein